MSVRYGASITISSCTRVDRSLTAAGPSLRYSESGLGCMDDRWVIRTELTLLPMSYILL